MATSARSPSRKAGGRRDLSPQQLVERVRELESAERDAKKNQLKEQKQRHRDLAEAKKKVVKEIQTASRLLQRGEKEAGKIATKVDQVERQAEQSKAKQTRQVGMIEDGLGRMRTKRNSLEATLHDKVSVVGEARGRFAYAGFAAKMLEAGIVVPLDGTAELPQGGVAQGAVSGDEEHPQQDAAQQVDRLAELEEENRQLRERLAELEALMPEWEARAEDAAEPEEDVEYHIVAANRDADDILDETAALEAALADVDVDCTGDLVQTSSLEWPEASFEPSDVPAPSPSPVRGAEPEPNALAVEEQQNGLRMSKSLHFLPRTEPLATVAGGSARLPPAGHIAVPSAGLLTASAGHIAVPSAGLLTASMPAGRVLGSPMAAPMSPGMWGQRAQAIAGAAIVVSSSPRSTLIRGASPRGQPMEPVALAPPPVEPVAFATFTEPVKSAPVARVGAMPVQFAAQVMPAGMAAASPTLLMNPRSTTASSKGIGAGGIPTAVATEPLAHVVCSPQRSTTASSKGIGAGGIPTAMATEPVAHVVCSPQRH